MYICDSEENSEDVFGIDGAVNWYHVWPMGGDVVVLREPRCADDANDYSRKKREH